MAAGGWNNEENTESAPHGTQLATLRRIALIGGIAQILFWLCLALYISSKANPLGDGLEWVAMVPATGILIVFVAPGLLLGLINRFLTLGVGLVLAAAIFNVLLFVQIAKEFASK